MSQSTLTFITESQAAFTEGAPYDFDLEASGGTAPYPFALTQGALPDGIAINSAEKSRERPRRPVIRRLLSNYRMRRIVISRRPLTAR
jgi:hypothetical protein